MLKYTDPSYSEYIDLTTALKMIQQLANAMNQVKVESEKYEKEAEKIRDIEILIDGFPHVRYDYKLSIR